MITVNTAKNKVKASVRMLQTTRIKVVDALHFFLAEDIVAPVAIPLFNQSAMDGYAFSFEDVNEALTIVDKIAAGDTRTISINKKEAVQIFTGSKVPDSCDTVVMQELVALIDGQLIIKDEGLKKGGNVRKKGNQLTKGSIALKKGTAINAGVVGFLSALGIATVEVYQQPKVAIIATGSELIQVGKKLQEGQVYESNTAMLQAALNKKGINPTIFMVEDHLEATQKVIAETFKTNDLVLISGGISVGEYDFVKDALAKNEVEEIFYKVKQKPGKPLFFGKTDTNYIFALPGNPAAALSCFYEYVLMAIDIMIGNPQLDLPLLQLPIKNSFSKKPGRASFLKGLTDFKTVTPLEGQNSDALQAFSLSNCFIYLPEEVEKINANELVEIHLLPY